MTIKQNGRPMGVNSWRHQSPMNCVCSFKNFTNHSNSIFILIIAVFFLQESHPYLP